MIRHGKPEDSEKIIDFLESIFKKESLIVYCSNLKENLEKSVYKSIILEEDNQIVAHNGIFFVDDIAIFNTLAVHPDYRGKGIARKLLEEGMRYCLDRKNITHVIGYCILNHPWSERIHDREFRPIGLMLCDKHPLKEDDQLYSQNLFNGNLVLCNPLQNIKRKIVINYKGVLEERIKKIFSKIRIEAVFINPDNKVIDFDNPPNYIEIDLNNTNVGTYLNYIEKQNYGFLGILPNINNGLLNLGFILKKNRIYNGFEIKVSDEERRRFIEEILFGIKNYE